MMKGILKNYRRGRDTQNTAQYIVEVQGIETRIKAASLAGKRVAWKTPGNKTISGKVMSAHGNSGAVRVKFDKGLPGQAIGATVIVSA